MLVPHTLSPDDRVQPPTLNPSDRTCSLSPLGPLSPPPAEGFNWPDVRELRSRYSDLSCSRMNLLSRSQSIPEQMFDGGTKRRSSCSSSLLMDNVPPYRGHSSREARRDECGRRLHRANSLEPHLGGVHVSEVQRLQNNGTKATYHVTAETPLPNDPKQKMIIVEKVPEPQVEREETKEEDDSYVEIRSPTSREKISIMAVIDRCRAYQESDEYKQRDEAKARTFSTDHDDQSQRKNCGAQNMVKSLREKFQKTQ